MNDDHKLTNIREFVGFAIGCRVVDITCDDPTWLPDSEGDEGTFIVVHLDNGGTLTFPVNGFSFHDPDREDES